MTDFPYLSVIFLAPLLGAVFMIFLSEENKTAIRRIAAGATLISLALSILLLFKFDQVAGGFQFVEKIDWIPSLVISWHLGVD